MTGLFLAFVGWKLKAWFDEGSSFCLAGELFVFDLLQVINLLFQNNSKSPRLYEWLSGKTHIRTGQRGTRTQAHMAWRHSRASGGTFMKK
jgi:hypothetical protein